MTTVADILSFLDEYCPFSLAESWDNPGLNCGRRNQPVKRVLLAVDVTPEAIETAAAEGCQLLLTHHPLTFTPQLQLTDDTAPGRAMLRLAELGVAHVACHTNLDAAEGGVNDILAACCGLTEVQPLGIGRMGATETTAEALIDRLKKNLPAKTCIGAVTHEQIRKVAVVGGSGGGTVEEAARAGCDTFVTGEAKHHHALLARELDVNLLIFGHYETEYIVLPPLAEALAARFPGIRCRVLPYSAPLDRW